MPRVRSALIIIAILAWPIAFGGLGHALRGAALHTGAPLLSWLGKVRPAVAAPAEDAPENKIRELTLEVARLRVKEQELTELRALVGFDAPAGSAVIPANVIGAGLDPERRVIFIDRGTDAGILPGLPAIGASKHLIGIIESATPTTAVIRLLTDPESSVSAVLLPSGRDPVVATGVFGTGIALTLIPGTESLTPGMLAVTAGIEEEIPRGIVIGTVGNELPSREPPFKSAALIPAPEVTGLPRVVGILHAIP